MDIIESATNRGNKSIIFDSHTYRLSNVLKNGDQSYRCSKKTCKARITTDAECKTVVKSLNEHNHTSDMQKVDAQQLRVRVRKASGDISQRPAKIIRTELQGMEENYLSTNDLKNASMAIYRERRKQYPALPKNRADVHVAMGEMTIQTNKFENYLMINDVESGIIIFSCTANLECLCNSVKDIFVDGTFKCCPRFFFQMYSIHGCKNGNYVPLLYALLPSKTQECYENMLNFVLQLCEQRNLTLKPLSVHIDFEQSMHNAIMRVLPGSKIECCRFHLGQNWWRKIQNLGLSTEYKEKTCDIGKWLLLFFGLPYLPQDQIEDSFVEDIMDQAPSDERCVKFMDYVLETYITSDSRYPPSFWASAPTADFKRTNNGPESFHAHFNEQFYSKHPNMFIYVDVIQKIQTTTYIKLRSLDTPAVVRRWEKEKTEYLVEKNDMFCRGEISRKEYIRTLAYKCSARTDL